MSFYVICFLMSAIVRIGGIDWEHTLQGLRTINDNEHNAGSRLMNDNDHSKEVDVTDDSFFETTEQIQAVIGVEGFGT